MARVVTAQARRHGGKGAAMAAVLIAFTVSPVLAVPVAAFGFYWHWRYWETQVIAAAAGALIACTIILGAMIGPVLWLAAITGVAWHPRSRAWLLQRQALERMRRLWRGVCASSGLATRPVYETDRRGHRRLVRAGSPGPMLVAFWYCPTGLAIRVRCGAGHTHADVAKAATSIATYYGARGVRVDPDRHNISDVTITVQTRDPLEDRRPIPWPVQIQARSIWGEVPFGQDEHGRQRTIELVGHHVLLGGESGSGKSIATSLLVSAAALSTDAALHICDGKEIDFQDFEPVAESFAGANVEDAIRVLEHVREIMDTRYAELRAARQKKVRRGDGHRLHVLVIDELHFYSAAPDRKQRTTFNALLRDLCARGRAAGVTVVCATQKPSGDTVPTSLRDLIQYRFALRCATPAASDTIMGAGSVVDASIIPGGHPGLGYLMTEGDAPARIRSFYVDENDLERIATAAAELRGIDTAPAPTVTVAAEAPPTPTQATAQDTAARPAPKRSAARERLQLSLTGAPPRTRADLLRACGADPKDRTYRLALEELRRDGQAVEHDGHWTVGEGVIDVQGDAAIPASPHSPTPGDTVPEKPAAERDSAGVVVYDTRFGVSPPDTPNGRAA